MVLYEVSINGTPREVYDVNITWDADFKKIPTWTATLSDPSISVTKGQSVEIKRKNDIDSSLVSIFQGIVETINPKMTNAGLRTKKLGGRHNAVKLWRKYAERNSDNGGFWTNYYPHKIVTFLTRHIRSPKPQKIRDKWYRRIGWGMDPRDSSNRWRITASSTSAGSASNLKDRYNTKGWTSDNNQNGEWLKIDLRSAVDVVGIRIENRHPLNNNYLRGYTIQTSLTDSGYTTRATQALNKARNIVETWTPVSAQWIKINGTVTTTGPAFIGEIFIYTSTGDISGISIGTLNEYLPFNCSEITVNQASGDTHVHVRHSHKYQINDHVLVMDENGNESVDRKVTAIDGATEEITLDGTIGFAVNITNNPWLGNMSRAPEINLDYKRRTESIDKIVKMCITLDNDPWEWWITDAGAVNMAAQRGSDVSGTVSFEYSENIAASEHKEDDRKAVDSVLVLPRSGSDMDAQDRDSSGWIGTGDYEEIVFDDTAETQEAAISIAEAFIRTSAEVTDVIIAEVDDNEVATGTWGIGDTIEMIDSAMGYSGDYRVKRLQRSWGESGENIIIEANSKLFSITDDIYGISRNAKAGTMQQIYQDQYRRMQEVTGIPEYVLFYEAESLGHYEHTSYTELIDDDTASGGMYLERQSTDFSGDIFSGPGLTLKPGLYRVRFWCKVASNSSGSNVATLAVDSDDKGSVFESVIVQPNNFTASDTWEGITFLFNVDTEYTDIELKITFVTGVTDFACDWVALMVGGTDKLVEFDMDYPAGAPAKPTGLSATGRPTGAWLVWNSNTEADLSHYKVYKHTADVFGSATEVGDVLSTAFWYGAPTAEYGTTLYFWITAVDWVGNISTESDSDSAGILKIDTIELAIDSVKANQIQDLAVETAKLADAAVSNLKLGLNAVDYDNIINDAITAVKLKAGVQPFISDVGFVPKVGDTNDSLTYTSGTIRFADGGTQSITGANIDNMTSGLHYIYFTVGSTALSETTTYSDCIGDDKGLLAWVQVSTDSTQELLIYPFYSKGLNLSVDALAVNAVTANIIKANAVIADKINANAVTAVKINAGAVTTNKLHAGAVITSKLDAGAVTAQKMTIYSVLLDNPNFHITSGALDWDAHDLQYEGTIYNIASGGAGTNNTYIWWDEGDSVYTPSNDKPDILNDQTIHPIAVFDDAADDWWEVWKPTVIHGGMIIAETITTEELTAEFITAKKMRTASSGARVEIGGASGNTMTSGTYGVYGYDSGGNTTFELDASDGTFLIRSASSGTRIEINPTHVAGYNLTTLQFELKSSDGKAYFAGGDAWIDSTGIHMKGHGEFVYFYDTGGQAEILMGIASSGSTFHIAPTGGLDLDMAIGSASAESIVINTDSDGANYGRVAINSANSKDIWLNAHNGAGNIHFVGDMTVQTDSTYNIGTNTVRFLNIYGDKVYGAVYA